MAKDDGDLIAQAKNNKSYKQQASKAAGMIDKGFLTEPAAAAKRSRPNDGVEGAALQAGSMGRNFAKGTQGAEPQRFAKGGKVAKLAIGGTPGGLDLPTSGASAGAPNMIGIGTGFSPAQKAAAAMPQSVGAPGPMATPASAPVGSAGGIGVPPPAAPSPGIPNQAPVPLRGPLGVPSKAGLGGPPGMGPLGVPSKAGMLPVQSRPMPTGMLPAQAGSAQSSDPWAQFEATMGAMGNQSAGLTGNEIQAAKRGGRIALAKGGPVPRYADGGRHGDEAQDKKLFKKMFKQEESTEAKGYAKGGSMKVGGGGRFAKLKGELSHKKGITNPGGLAAAIGRNKYGAGKMAKMAAAGRHAEGGPIGKNQEPAETGVMKGPKNPTQKYAKGGKAEPKASKPSALPARKAQKLPPAPPPMMPDNAPPMGAPPMGGSPPQGFAVGGVAKIRHGEMTEGQKQKPNKPSGWNAYK